MASNNENITVLGTAVRLAKKLRQPGAFRDLKWLLSPDQAATKSIGGELQARASEMPDGIAIKYQDRHYTWADYNAWVNRVARVLEAQGVAKGDRVAINIQNRPECLVSVVATAKLGAIAAMINTSQEGEVLAHSLSLAEAKLVIVGEEQVAAMATVPDLLAGESNAGLLYWADDSDNPAPEGYRNLAELSANQDSSNLPVTASISLKDKAYLIFTSGTTGMPKASIMGMFRWYISSIGMGRFTMSLTPDDVFYCCLPFYHNNALTLSMGGCLVSGSTIAIGRKFSASRFWDECRHYEATCFSYIGELLRYLLNQQPKPSDRDHKVEKILGNGLRPDVWDAFKERFGVDRVHEFYGASEGTNAFINAFNYDKTVGWAASGWEIIGYDVDADEPRQDAKGRFIKLGKGDTGLLVTEVSDLRPFEGYTDKSAGEKKLLRDVFKKGDCWFNTGDLVKSQGAGHVQFVDRVGDTFRWQGENVATTEVEAAMIKWPQTEDAAVYGVQVPNRDGRCGMVSYTPKAGEELDLANFAKHLQSSLPKYAVPRFMRLQGAQAVTGTFKHQKAALKKEGYDISLIEEPVYYLAPGSDSWVLITPELKKQIDTGEARL